MIPSSKDLILQKKVKLYNNLANIDNCQGRLLAELEIYPNPRIIWDFEVLGDTKNFPYLAHTNEVKPLTLSGHAFLIEQELGVFNDLKTNIIGSKNLSENRETNLENAVKRIQDICVLLSCVNGGYVGLLYLEGYQRDARNIPIFSSAIALSSQTTPLEKIGLSWFTNNSNLKQFMECIPAFEKMIQNDLWRETFDFVLIHYFQATQVGLVGWPVIASAVGAALERLSYMILVLEEPNLVKKNINELLFTQSEGKKQKQYNREFKKKDKYKKQDGKYLSKTGIRLICLLNRIGLTEDNNPDVVQSFLNIRNNAVHPIVSNMDLDERKKTIVKAIQWIDEIILWRIGYSGQYRDRTQSMESSINPRYNLTLRDVNL